MNLERRAPLLHMPMRSRQASPRVRIFAAAALVLAVALVLIPRGAGVDSSTSQAFTLAPGAPLRLRAPQRHILAPLRASPNRFGQLLPLTAKKAPRKPPFLRPQLLSQITKMNKEGIKETVQVLSGVSTIIPAMIGHTIAVHNGRDYVPLVISESMVGFKLWEFVRTRAFQGHPKQNERTAYRRKSTYVPPARRS